MSVQARPVRPGAVTRLGFGVTILGVLGVALSSVIFALSYMIMILHVSGFFAVITGIISRILLVIGVLVLIPAGLTLLVGYGLLSGRRWAYPIGIIVSMIDVIDAFIQFAAGGSITGIIDLATGLWMLSSLLKPEVKAYFSNSPRSTSTI